MQRVNFLQADYFKYKFKRDPKYWSISQLHDLWIENNKRSELRQKEFSDFIRNIIVKEIPMMDDGYHYIYINKGNDIYRYEFKYEKQYKSYSISSRRIELKTRDEKLTFILANDKAFELGYKYLEIDNKRTYLNQRVFGILWQLLEDELRNHFRKIDKIPDEIFKISINDIEYYIQVDERFRYGYYKFHFKGECKNEVVSYIKRNNL